MCRQFTKISYLLQTRRNHISSPYKLLTCEATHYWTANLNSGKY